MLLEEEGRVRERGEPRTKVLILELELNAGDATRKSF